jgi:hypothetical protein
MSNGLKSRHYYVGNGSGEMHIHRERLAKLAMVLNAKYYWFANGWDVYASARAVQGWEFCFPALAAQERRGGRWGTWLCGGMKGRQKQGQEQRQLRRREERRCFPTFASKGATQMWAIRVDR